MKKYQSPAILIVKMAPMASMLAVSDGRLTGGKSNAGQSCPVAESNRRDWADDADEAF